MYIAHYGLKTLPFAITPDPHFLYLSERHREALAHLLYGINEGTGFVLLTGEVGTGKTTLCRSLVEQLSDNVDVALLFNPRLSSMELLAALFDELRIEYQRNTFTLKDFIDTLNTYLLTAHSVGRKTVLILDEAQNLTTDALEQIRLLTNLETTNHKLLQIILVGQPELNSTLKRRNLRQLAQRITARYHLLPLSAKDTDAYINHRLAISGAKAPLFTKSAMRLIYRYSSGIPRLINIICDRALLGGYVNNQRPINNNIVRKAVYEVRGETVTQANLPSQTWLIFIFLIVVLFGGFMWWVNMNHDIMITPKKVIALPLTIPPKTIPIPVAEATASPTSTVANAGVSLSHLGLSELLQQIDPTGNTDTALITLFRQWQLDYTQQKGETACERAASQGLACLYKSGDWEDIRRYNRPVVIELISNTGTQHLVAITRLREHIATLNFAGDTYEFSTDQLANHWLGQFLLLWHPPALPIPLLKQGMSSESVLWLRKQLAVIEGKKVETEQLTTRFDSALRKRVVTFQKRHNLLTDGIVGQQTMMILNAEAGEVPLLWFAD